MDNKITNVLNYRIEDSEYWIYSTLIDNDNYKYYLLTLNDNIPSISDIKSPLELLQNIGVTPTEIYENSIEYIRFLAIKNIAENKVLYKMKETKR